ncbi:MAG: CoA-binding protein [Gemmatimonadetes bacterium]|jgi:predicted CoA-binding protein|nr:CoA-binding protein [Gemmatimonadota bacterium]
MNDWRDNLVDQTPGIQSILREARRVAVLGIKTEEQSGQPAFWVPEYLKKAGYEILPVPVYYPEATEILGQPVYRSVAMVPGTLDLVLVFRRPRDVPPHVDDLLAAQPKAVWMQSGIRNEEAARRLAEAGIKVVQNRCAMVEHRQLAH